MGRGWLSLSTDAQPLYGAGALSPRVAHGPGLAEPLVAVASYDEKLRPVLAREPLEQAENNYAEALLL